jgi:hypothetical protein
MRRIAPVGRQDAMDRAAAAAGLGTQSGARRSALQPRYRSLADLVRGNDGGFWRLIEQRPRKREKPLRGESLLLWRSRGTGPAGSTLPYEMNPNRDSSGRHGAAPQASRDPLTTEPAALRLTLPPAVVASPRPPAARIGGKARDGSFYCHCGYESIIPLTQGQGTASDVWSV